MIVENKQIRKFEVVSKYEGKGINLPIRKTKFSAGYDIESAVDITIPSIWQQMFGFIDTVGAEGYNDIMKVISSKTKDGHSVSDIMKEFNLKPTLIPTGIKAYMHDDEVLILASRSSTPMKHGLVMSNNLGWVDCDYVDNPDNEGEMFVQVLNFLPFDVEIKKNTPIAQGFFKKYLTTDDDIISDEIRVSGFGSTDKQ